MLKYCLVSSLDWSGGLLRFLPLWLGLLLRLGFLALLNEHIGHRVFPCVGIWTFGIPVLYSLGNLIRFPFERYYTCCRNRFCVADGHNIVGIQSAASGTVLVPVYTFD